MRSTVLALEAMILLKTASTLFGGSLEATITVPDRVYQGEPITLIAKIRNDSTQEKNIVVPETRRFGRDSIEFFFQPPGTSDFKRILHPDVYVGGMKMMAPKPCPIIRLAPDETVEYVFSVAYDFMDSRCYQKLFDTPGKYSFQVSLYEPLHVKDGEMSVSYDSEWKAIKSEITSTVVVAPTGIRERQALNALANLPCEYLLYGPFEFRADCHADAIKDFQQFFREYSGTRLGRRAALPLGIALSQGLVQDDSHAIIETLEKLAHDDDLELRQSALGILSFFEGCAVPSPQRPSSGVYRPLASPPESGSESGDSALLKSPGEALSVNISLHKTSIVLGEPLYIIARLEHKGAFSLSMVYQNSPSFNIGEGWGRIMISNKASDFSNWSDDVRLIEKVAPAALIRPYRDSAIANDYVVGARGLNSIDNPEFLSSGKYKIKLEYVLTTGDVAVSEPVEFEVKEPVGEEKAIWNRLCANRLYWLLVQAPWEVNAKADAAIDFEKELNLVKGTVYAQYMALGIGRSLLYGGNRNDAMPFLQHCATTSDNEFISGMVKKIKDGYSLQ